MKYVVFLIMGTVAFSRSARTVHLNDKRVEPVYLAVGRTTVLSFMTKPSKVLLGNRGMFAVEYVDNDVAIAPLLLSARSNLFIYIEGRRYAFDLMTGSRASDEIVIVRDTSQTKIPVKLK